MYVNIYTHDNAFFLGGKFTNTEDVLSAIQTRGTEPSESTTRLLSQAFSNARRPYNFCAEVEFSDQFKMHVRKERY